jgi:FtsZ-binding cell division protein ZapB
MKILQQQLDAMNASHQKEKSLNKTTKSGLLSKIAELEIEGANKDIELDSLKKIKLENQKLKNALNKCKSEMTKLQPTVEELKAKCNSLKVSSDTLQSKCDTLEKKSEMTRNEADLVNDNLRIAQAKLSSLESRQKATTDLLNKQLLSGFHRNNIVLTKKQNDQMESMESTEGVKDRSDQPKQPGSRGLTVKLPPVNQVKPPTDKARPVTKKTTTRLVGDSLVRGMGPLLQSKNVSSLVVIKPGVGINQMANITREKWDEDILSIQCGTNDVGRDRLVEIINKYEDLIEGALKSHPERHLIVNEVPQPGGLFSYVLRKKIKDLNKYLATKCTKYDKAHFLPLELKCNLMQGVYVSPNGQKQMATKILDMVTRVQNLNFIEEGIITLT